MLFIILFYFHQFLQVPFNFPLFLLYPILFPMFICFFSLLFVLGKEMSHPGVLSFQAQKDGISPSSAEAM